VDVEVLEVPFIGSDGSDGELRGVAIASCAGFVLRDGKCYRDIVWLLNKLLNKRGPRMGACLRFERLDNEQGRGRRDAVVRHNLMIEKFSIDR